ncbi:MAG: response regulator transcription factor [Chloroflexi bacterium]|nr:response regulator transcription factor [Chloroflexota bacterium]
MHRVFIIAKDDGEIKELHSGLTRMGFVCSVANNSSNLSEELIKQACDVLFMDMDGSPASAQTESMLEQLRELRITRHFPAIALISGEGLSHFDSNLEIDDFVVKPWDIAELVIRAKRVIKRAKNVRSEDLVICDDLVIDIDKCEVSIDGRLLALTFKEYELLKFLARNKGRVFAREVLLNEVWGYDYYGGDRTVDVHIRRLRSKLNDPDNTYIQTVRNIGYRFSNGV